jgi:hypothetical protein
MEKIYKKIYILLGILLVIFLSIFTLINVFYYGSVIKGNIPTLSLLMVVPLYLGFKQNKYYKKTILILGVFLSLIILWTLSILPNYTYNEALTIVEEKYEPISLQVNRREGPSSFYYMGHYLIESKAHKIIFDFNSGNYKVIKQEAK